jgi:hypothetical protein
MGLFIICGFLLILLLFVLINDSIIHQSLISELVLLQVDSVAAAVHQIVKSAKAFSLHQ